MLMEALNSAIYIYITSSIKHIAFFLTGIFILASSQRDSLLCSKMTPDGDPGVVGWLHMQCKHKRKTYASSSHLHPGNKKHAVGLRNCRFIPLKCLFYYVPFHLLPETRVWWIDLVYWYIQVDRQSVESSPKGFWATVRFHGLPHLAGQLCTGFESLCSFLPAVCTTPYIFGSKGNYSSRPYQMGTFEDLRGGNICV